MENQTETLYAMPFFHPRQIVEFEIDAHGADYNSVAEGAKKICADYKDCELHLKFFNLSPSFGTDSLDSTLTEPFNCTKETVKKMIMEELDKIAIENLKVTCPQELWKELQSRFPYLKSYLPESPTLQD